MHLDREILLNPFPLFRTLRERNPVMFAEPLNAWMAFRYADVKRVYMDHAAFSSKNPMRLPPESPLSIETLVFSDPPNHTRLRRLAQSAFTPRRVAALETRITEMVQEQLNGITDPTFDLVSAFSGPFPALVIAEMLGVPASDREFFQRLANGCILIGTPGKERESLAAIDELAAYTSQVIQRKRLAPDDQLISAWLRGEGEEQPATEAEIISFGTILLVAGHETTTNLLNNAVRSLSESEEARALIKTPEAAPLIIEEVLRYRGPLTAAPRRAVADIELGGQTIPAGSLVLGMIGAANRDPDVFTNPDTFEPLRGPKGILSFGAGIHRCLGEPLARLEARVALPLLYTRFPDLRVDSSRAPEPVLSPFIHGVRTLPVRA